LRITTTFFLLAGPVLRLDKRHLFEKVFEAIKTCGWQFIQISPLNAHPLRLGIFRENETYTVRIYIWNLTHGGGPVRPADEYRIQITGVSRFALEPGGKTLILGWWDEAEVFAGFDYRKHSGTIGSSPSMQIREEFLRQAYETGFSPCNKGNREIAIAFRPDFLVEYVRSLESLHDVGNSRTDFEVLEAVAENPDRVNDADLESVTSQRRSAIASVRRTLRDAAFKNRVLTCYSHRCAMCDFQLDLVEAAHIVPVAEPTSTDETSNGIALCILHHRAYDKVLVSVGDNYRVLSSNAEQNRLREIGHDGGIRKFLTALRPLIHLPPAVPDRPNVNYLRRSREIRRWVS
jgi:putative restriction endonuclease